MKRKVVSDQEEDSSSHEVKCPADSHKRQKHLSQTIGGSSVRQAWNSASVGNVVDSKNWLDLPVDVWDCVFRFSDLSHLFRLERVSRRAKALATTLMIRSRQRSFNLHQLFNNIGVDSTVEDQFKSRLDRVLEKCPNITEVELADCERINSGLLEFILSRSQLQSISLECCCQEMSGATFAHVSQNLKSLSLYGFTGLNTQTVYKLLLACPPTLQELSLADLSQATPAIVKALPHVGPNLTNLFLSCGFVDDDFCCAVGKHCPKLTQVRLLFCDDLSDAGLVGMLSQMPQLTAIAINDSERLSDTGLIELTKLCPELQHVDFQGCQKVTIAGLDYVLSNLPLLTELSLCVARKDLPFFESLTKFGKLHKLILCYFCGEQGMDVEIEVVVARLKRLQPQLVLEIEAY